MLGDELVQFFQQILPELERLGLRGTWPM